MPFVTYVTTQPLTIAYVREGWRGGIWRNLWMETVGVFYLPLTGGRIPSIPIVRGQPPPVEWLPMNFL